jgi:hypothetical protein
MLCLFVEETVCSSAVMEFEFVLGVHGMILFFCFFAMGGALIDGDEGVVIHA